MKHLFYIGLIIGLVSCGSDEQTPTENQQENTEDKVVTNQVSDKMDLVDVVGNQFTEYYPGRKNIKFQGTQDELGQRHGKWLYFSEEGVELSMSMYSHGLKHGHTIVKYPNGLLHYTGEYINDKQVGLWKTYTVTGELSEEKDYGYPEEK